MDLLLCDAEDLNPPRQVESVTRRSLYNEEQRPERVLQDRGINIIQRGDVALPQDAPPEEQSDKLSDRFYDFGAT